MARFFVFSAACGNARMFDSAGWILSYNGFDMGFYNCSAPKSPVFLMIPGSADLRFDF